MSEHLSPLALDELAVGDPNDAAKAHLDGCASCRLKLDAVKAAALQVRSMPGFEQTFAALDTERPAVAPPKKPRRLWPALVAVAVPLAAALVFLVMSPRDDGSRLKGAPTVELLLKDQPVTTARPGDTVTLAVGGAGKTHVLVLAVDASGVVSRLWPQEPQSAPIGAGARVSLSPSFDVTPGSLVLVGFFTDASQPAAPVLSAVEAQIAIARAAGRSPFQLELPTTFGRTARVTLEVAP
ncbi:MAG: zf-HC2 domain-containing protein [Myxococcales bacterium]|nr:zf-HC2 domain-containing protein [Myxococcales bacterium]